MSKITFASVGDTCLDIYSQEKREFLGGTAYNVAIATQKAGGGASLVSAVGTDTYGQVYLENAKQLGIDTSHLKVVAGITSNVSITLDTQKHPTFSKWNVGVLDNYLLSSDDLEFLAAHQIARAVLFKPLTKLIDQFAKHKMPQTLKVGDFAGGSTYSYDVQIVNEYKNDLDIFIRSSNKSEIDFLKDFAAKNKKIVLATLGNKGSIVFANNKVYRQPAVKLPNQVIDTTGAGDCFTAHFLISYFKSKNIQLALQSATQEAAKIITQLGAN